ncbi:hypothetical protein P4446_27575, partial [Bacillus tropicus]|uniref:hypothetical protein n=1 Tax=Bacillus tropicus TaxID=2026188 RepID=UPI002E1C9D57|nr:hypothetical protein [Bacillus tropicus]
NLSNLGEDTSRLEQGWNHENTFVPFLGMSVFFYFERRCSKMKQFVRTEITTTCMVKKQSKVIDRDK